MEDFLKQMTGKRIDVACGASAIVRGDVTDVKGGILYLRDENDRVAFVSIEKVTVVWEVKDQEVRTGFVTGKSNR